MLRRADIGRALVIARRPGLLRNSARIALFVGTVLNLINQGENFLGNSPVSWLHVILNYAVPFCVATYSATLHELQGQYAPAPQCRIR